MALYKLDYYYYIINIRINFMSPETRVNGLHFCHWYYGSVFVRFFCGELRNMHFFWNRMCIGHSRSSKVVVVDFGTNQKGVCDFLLVINGNFAPVLHRFWDTASYWLEIANVLCLPVWPSIAHSWLQVNDVMMTPPHWTSLSATLLKVTLLAVRRGFVVATLTQWSSLCWTKT